MVKETMTSSGVSEASVSQEEVRATNARFGGITAIVGALLMIGGAALWAIAGADLDAALVDGTVGSYLTDAAGNVKILTANLSLWMFGVVFLAAGGIGLSRLSSTNSAVATAAQGSYLVGAALGLAAFALWLGIVQELAPVHGQDADLSAVAAALGLTATTADWVATALIIGVGPGLISFAGKGVWVPRWLFIWGIVAVIASGVSILGLYIGGRATWAFIDVPVGVGWTLAAGIVALRHRTRT